MTLRVEVSIVPFGQEDGKYEIHRLDISNIQTIADTGFGHVICEYRAHLYRYNNETMQKTLGCDELEFQQGVVGIVHDRRDGALALIKKAIEKLESRDVDSS